MLRDDGEKADFYLGRERDWCQGMPDSVLIPCLPSPTWLDLHLEDGEPGNTGQEQTVPEAPESKSCGSKQAVASTQSLPAPAGLGWARPPGSIICSVGMWECQEHPLPSQRTVPASRKGLESSRGLQDVDEPTFLLPFGISAPSRSSSTPDPAAPPRGFEPLPPPTAFLCLHALLGGQVAHSLAQ